MGIFDFFKRNKQLTGKVRLMNIYCVPDLDRTDDCGYFIACHDDRYHKGKRVSTSSVLTISNSIKEQWIEDKKGRAQGPFQQFDVGITDKELLPNQVELGKTPDGKTLFRYLRQSGEYKDSKAVGIVTEYNQDGSVKDYFRPWTCACRPGYFKQGDSVKEEWKEKVEGLKFEKEMDRPARSATLKKVLEAGSKQDKMKVLKEFHSKKSPAGIKRHTALKFDR